MWWKGSSVLKVNKESCKNQPVHCCSRVVVAWVPKVPPKIGINYMPDGFAGKALINQKMARNEKRGYSVKNYWDIFLWKAILIQLFPFSYFYRVAKKGWHLGKRKVLIKKVLSGIWATWKFYQASGQRAAATVKSAARRRMRLIIIWMGQQFDFWNKIIWIKFWSDFSEDSFLVSL